VHVYRLYTIHYWSRRSVALNPYNFKLEGAQLRLEAMLSVVYHEYASTDLLRIDMSLSRPVRHRDCRAVSQTRKSSFSLFA
jgi:hypothetical protein